MVGAEGRVVCFFWFECLGPENRKVGHRFSNATSGLKFKRIGLLFRFT